VQQLLKRLVPRRLTRYIFGECLHFFALCLTAFTGILFTIRILKFSSLIINKGVDPHQIGRVFFAVIPTFLEFALPLAALLAVMLAFARLSGDSEVVVLRCPLWTIGICLCDCCVFVSEALGTQDPLRLTLRHSPE
jgi:Lipopolysaccharide export system permease LptF/LptG